MSVKKLRRFTRITLVVSNVIIAIFLIAGTYGSYLNPEKYWFMGFFTLAAFYFLLLCVCFMLFWFIARRSLTLISFIAIALCWKPVLHLIPLRISPAFVLKKDAGSLRVMSWNVEHFDILEHKSHPERKQQMINMVNDYQPDIACFQEMVASDHFPSAINYVPDFMASLHMYDYSYAFNQKLDFDGKHHFGIIIFSKYPIINKQTLAFPPRDYNSIFQYVDVVKNADTVRIFNVHLQSLKFTNDNLRYIETPTIHDNQDFSESRSVVAKFKLGFLKRKRQSDRISEAIKQSPYPAIVCGDFNDVPNSYAYETIGSGMKNAFAEKGSGIGRTFYSISPTLRIDNIFVDERYNVQQYVRIKKKLSDHFPIIADIERSHH